MRRRDVLTGAGLATAAGLSFPAPAIAQGVRRLRMVTDLPDGPSQTHNTLLDASVPTVGLGKRGEASIWA
jgi:hypothetical protein